MALPITVPYAFANATTTQNLSYLDADFNTITNAVNGIGNGTVSLSNVNITGGNVANVTFTGVVTAPDEGYQRNRIINGAMQIWQRGTSFTVSATGNPTYTTDRWGVSPAGSSVSVGQGGAPSGYPYSLSVTGNTGNTGINIQQRIESVNCVDLNSTTVTVSGYVFQSTGSNLSGVTVKLLRCNSTDNYSSTTQMGSIYTIPTITTSTWTKFTCTFTTDSSASNGFAVLIDTNIGFNSSSAIAVTGIQLEAGSVATPFERRLYGTELALSQRYYFYSGGTSSYVVQTFYTSYQFKVTMRTTPTVTLSITPLGISIISDGFLSYYAGQTGASVIASAEL
jgi:hypothetical protein